MRILALLSIFLVSCVPTQPPYYTSVELVSQAPLQPIITGPLELKETVTDGSAAPVIDGLRALAGQPATIIIDSPGGSVSAGLDLIKAIEAHGNVSCRVDGLAASMAMVILQSCHHRSMTGLSILMSHPVSIGSSGPATVEELEKLGGLMKALTDSLTTRVCWKLIIPGSLCRKRVLATWWLGSGEALSVKAVDVVIY